MILYGIILNSREIPLSEILAKKGLTQLRSVQIKVYKDLHILCLYEDTMLVKKYKAVFGRSINPKRYSADDLVTPIGSYKICGIDSSYNYYKILYLNFPNENDAAEALKENIISRDEYLNIITTQKNNICYEGDTKLGKPIGIQGMGKYNFIFKNLPFVFNWTNGSIALSNEDIDELMKYVGIGTSVKISYSK